jgi:hypothetical protein
MKENDRFTAIMTLFDAWAAEFAGWDCRVEAECEVRFILGEAEYDNWSDEMIVDAAIAAWEEAT